MLDRRRNPQATGIWAGIILGVAGILLMVVPSRAGVDGMDGGFALGAFGLLLLIAGAITLAIMLPRAARMRDMLSERNLLAHWTYDSEQMAQEAERIQEQWSRRNRGLFIIVLGWIVVITAAFVVFMLVTGEADALPSFLGIMGGVTLLVAAAAFGMPYLMARRARRSQKEALIADRAVYFGGSLYTWGTPLEVLDKVVYVDDDGDRRLSFHLRSRSGPYFQFLPYLVEVPVPLGQEGCAEEVVRRLSRP